MIKSLKKIMLPDEIKRRFPINDSVKAVRDRKIKEIEDILSGADKRLLLIIGPCSADNEVAFYQYLSLLKGIEKEIRNRILIVPRLYTTKPRSKWDSYKGILYSPDPLSQNIDIEKGILAARRMFITALADYEFACADEFLYLDTYSYFDDVVSYAVIGARNSESQQHKFFASGLDIPTAIKNPMNGDISPLCDAVFSAQHKNIFLHNGCQVESSGNSFAHAILRGGTNSRGEHFANCDIDNLRSIRSRFEQMSMRNPAVIIDTSHSNSAKDFLRQGDVISESFKNISEDADVRNIFAGYMIESYIKDGSCKDGTAEFGMSVTDSCLGWEKTEELIFNLYAQTKDWLNNV